MKRLLVAALFATTAVGAPPSANAVCAHSHGYPHAHSGRCGCMAADAECEDLSIDSPLADRVICIVAGVVKSSVVQC